MEPIRIDIPPVGDLPAAWIDIRRPESLTGDDDDAWHKIYFEVRMEDAEANLNEAAAKADDAFEVTPDGTAMVPKKPRRVTVPKDMVRRQRDALIGRLITGWSYSEPPWNLALPYTTAMRGVLPLRACKAIDQAILPHVSEITSSGPKETPSGSSTSTSPAESPSSHPASTAEPPTTA
jgi:hypothetical protein